MCQPMQTKLFNFKSFEKFHFKNIFLLLCSMFNYFPLSYLPLSAKRLSVSSLCIPASLTAVDEEIKTYVSDETKCNN